MSTELSRTSGISEGHRCQADTRIYGAWDADLAHTTKSSFQEKTSMNMTVGIHPSWQPQGRNWSQFLSCGILHRTRQTCISIIKQLEGWYSVCPIPGSWWLFIFAQLSGISMALLLAQNGECAGREVGESFLVMLFLWVYKYSLAEDGSSHKMAIQASLPLAFPSTLTSLPAQQNPITNPSLLKAWCHPNSFAAAFDLASASRYRFQSILWDALHSFVSYKTFCSILWAVFHKILSNIM